MPDPFLRFSGPPGAPLGPEISKLVSAGPKLGPPVISETLQVGIFCLLTKLLIYVSTTTVIF